MRLLKPFLFSISMILFHVVRCLYAQDITDAEYLQLKDKLKSEFMQKLKEEIKSELIKELKAEYTIVPKQKHPAETGVVLKTETTQPDIAGNQTDNREDERKEDSVIKRGDMKTAEQSEDISALELDKAHYKLGEGITFGEQLLHIRGFGNVNARYQDNPVNKNFAMGDNFFSLGEFDLFMTSKLSNRISFLNETVFEFEQGETGIDIERLLIHYDINNLLKIEVGKFFLPIGYWIPTYNHGLWFQTTADRPDIVNFQDKGGPIPTHDTGIKLLGNALLEGADVNYAFAVTNGRGIDTTQRQNFGDANDKKALSMQIEVLPHCIAEGLRLGPSIYYDVIPEDTTSQNRKNEIRELIYGGHAAYTFHNTEVLMEVFEINHDEISGSVFNTFGGYLQLAYSINKYKPYYRYDYIDYSDNDPFYNESKFNYFDTKRQTLGLRYDLSHFNALKLEYSHGVIGGEDSNAIGLQTAFSF